MSAYSDLILAHPNLSGYYRMGEASGTTLVDSGPNALNGVIVAAGTTYSVAGALTQDSNTALSNDATTSSTFATVADNNGFDLGDGPLSLELWFQRTATQGAAQTLLAKGGTTYELRFNATNTVGFFKQGTAGAIASSSAAYTDTTVWHHLIVSKNGTFSALYLDGVDATVAGTNQTLGDSTTVLRFLHQGANVQRAPVAIDEVSIYKGAVLSEADALQRYQTALGIVTFNIPPATITTAPTDVASGISVAFPSAAVSGAGTGQATGLDAALPTAGVTVSAPVGGFAQDVALPAAGATVSAPVGGFAQGVALPAAGVTVSAPVGGFAQDAALPAAGATVSAPAGSFSQDAALPAAGATVSAPAGGFAQDAALPAAGVTVSAPAGGFAQDAALPAAGVTTDAVIPGLTQDESLEFPPAVVATLAVPPSFEGTEIRSIPAASVFADAATPDFSVDEIVQIPAAAVEALSVPPDFTLTDSGLPAAVVTTGAVPPTFTNVGAGDSGGGSGGVPRQRLRKRGKDVFYAIPPARVVTRSKPMEFRTLQTDLDPELLAVIALLS